MSQRQGVESSRLHLQASLGWARRLVADSIRKAAFLMVGVWQLGMIAAAWFIGGWQFWALGTAHLLMALIAFRALRAPSKIPQAAVPFGMGLLSLADFLMSGNQNSVLAFAACWQLDFATCVAGLVIRKRRVVPLAILGTLAISTVVLLFLPEWDRRIVFSFPLTQAAIIFATHYGLPQVLKIAELTDAQEIQVQQTAGRAGIIRSVSEQVAEELRTLHDTAINTLGAIASNSVATASVSEIRSQCANDLQQLEALRQQRRNVPSAGFTTLFSHTGLRVYREGLDNDELELVTRELGTRRVSGMVAAAREALNNVRKYAGTGQATVGIWLEGRRLLLEVRDQGTGFVGDLPPGHGIMESIFKRGSDFGFSANLRTLPGEGTVVSLAAELDHERTDSRSLIDWGNAADIPSVIQRMKNRAALLWSLGAAAVSIMLTFSVNPGELEILVPMCALLLCLWFYAAITRTTGARGAAILACAAVPVVFFLTAIATGFGSRLPTNWQALAPTSAFVLLSISRYSRLLTVIALPLWGLAIAASAWIALKTSLEDMAIVVLAGIVGMGFIYAWLRYLSTVASLAETTASRYRQALAAQVRMDADEAAQNTYKRWLEAGLEHAIALLRKIASGQANPSHREVQQACATEESYLRQLLAIGPELVHLGPKVLPVIRSARERSMDFALRLGSRDARDEHIAEEISQVLYSGLAAARSSDRIAATIYPRQNDLQLTVVVTPEQAQPGGRESATGSSAASLNQYLYPARTKDDNEL